MSEIEILERDSFQIKFRTTFRNAIFRLKNYQKLLSKTFIFRDIPWNISLDAHTFKSLGNDKVINFYLNCLETKPEFSCRVNYTFSAIRASAHPLEKNCTNTFGGSILSGTLLNCFPMSHLSDFSEGFIFDGALTIQVELKAELPPTLTHQDANDKLIQSLQPSVTKGLIKDMDDLLESGDGDVTFKMEDGAMIKAHKSILCARNPVFVAMLSADMKEAKTKEIMIDDMGRQALKILLLHIYSGQLSLPEGLDLDSCKEVVNAAEKYNLQELKQVSGLALVKLAMKTPQDAFEHYKFLKRLNVGAATKLASFIKMNVDEMLAKC